MIQNPTSGGTVSIEFTANLAAMLVRWQDKFENWGGLILNPTSIWIQNTSKLWT
jgi:hypothetical protein